MNTKIFSSTLSYFLLKCTSLKTLSKSLERALCVDIACNNFRK